MEKTKKSRLQRKQAELVNTEFPTRKLVYLALGQMNLFPFFRPSQKTALKGRQFPSPHSPPVTRLSLPHPSTAGVCELWHSWKLVQFLISAFSF